MKDWSRQPKQFPHWMMIRASLNLSPIPVSPHPLHMAPPLEEINIWARKCWGGRKFCDRQCREKRKTFYLCSRNFTTFCFISAAPPTSSVLSTHFPSALLFTSFYCPSHRQPQEEAEDGDDLPPMSIELLSWVFRKKIFIIFFVPF